MPISLQHMSFGLGEETLQAWGELQSHWAEVGIEPPTLGMSIRGHQHSNGNTDIIALILSILCSIMVEPTHSFLMSSSVKGTSSISTADFALKKIPSIAWIINSTHTLSLNPLHGIYRIHQKSITRCRKISVGLDHNVNSSLIKINLCN